LPWIEATGLPEDHVLIVHQPMIQLFEVFDPVDYCGGGAAPHADASTMDQWANRWAFWYDAPVSGTARVTPRVNTPYERKVFQTLSPDPGQGFHAWVAKVVSPGTFVRVSNIVTGLALGDSLEFELADPPTEEQATVRHTIERLFKEELVLVTNARDDAFVTHTIEELEAEFFQLGYAVPPDKAEVTHTIEVLRKEAI
jgi:hypothetical protein